MKTKNEGQNLIFEEGDVFTAQKYLRNLASGRSPLDGADLAEDHLLREPALVNAMNLAADLLEAWLSNGGFNRVEPKRTRPFAISDTDRKKILITKEPGNKRRYSTPTGQQLGIRTVDRRGADGSSYRKNVYDENAQRLIIDNLEGIVTYASQLKVQEAAEIVEKARQELEAMQRQAEEEQTDSAPAGEA